MANNKTVYSLDLDATGLVQGYQKALKEMENAGYSVQVTGNIRKELEKLVADYDVLKKQAKAGFSNPREVATFTENMNKLIDKFSKLDSMVGNASTSLVQMYDKVKQSMAKLSNVFSSRGFTEVKKITEDIVAATNKEEVIVKTLNTELERRVQLLNEAKKVQAEMQAKQAAATSVITGYGKNAKGVRMPLLVGYETTDENGKTFSKEENVAKIIEKAQQLATHSSKNIKQIWKELNEYIRNNGLGKELTDSGEKMAQFKQQIEQAHEAAKAMQKDLKEANSKVSEQQRSVDQLGTEDGAGSGTYKLKEKAITEANKAVKELEKSYGNLGKVMQDAHASEEQINNAMQVGQRQTLELANNTEQARKKFYDLIGGIEKTVTTTTKMAKSIENLRQRILLIFSATSIFYKLRTELNKTFESVKQLDKSFASIAMVTDKTLSDMWAQYDKYADMATKLGQSTNDMIKASALFYQQGLDTNEALQLTTDTMKLATLASTDFSTATKEMTSTIHGFNMEMNEGSHITDVYSELAAHAAASVDEIAKAMERTASIANSAGMSFENTSVFLTHMLETTQEGAENIGTSLKTIIARFGELKNNVSAADSEFDDLDLNKVDKALKSIGVQLKDENLQFRDLDEVLLELSAKWSSLDRNTQRYIATIAAGSRQQSRFLALMDGYDRTVELMETAAEAEGKANQQFAKYADTVEYRLKQLQTKWEEFKVSIMNSDMWKGLLTTASGLLDRLNGVDTKRLAIGATMGILIGRQLISALTKQITSSAQVLSDSFNGAIKRISNKFHDSLFAIKPGTLDKVKAQLESKVVELKTTFAQAFNLDPTNLTQVEAAINKYAIDISKATTATEIYNIVMGENALAIEDDKIALAELRRIFGEIAVEDDKFIEKLREMSMAANRTANSVGTLNARTLELTDSQAIAHRQTSAWGSALTQGLSTITMGLTGLISGTMDAEESFKSMTTMSTMMIITNLIPAIQQVGTALIETKSLAVALGSSISAMSVLITGTFALLTFVGQKVAAYLKTLDNNTIESQLKRVNELLEKQEEIISETESKAKEARKAYTNVEDLKKRYEELSNRIVLTEEEQEEYNKLVEQIINDFPDLIDSYNEITKELTLQSEKWDEILEKQKRSKILAEGGSIESQTTQRDLQYYDYRLKADEADKAFDTKYTIYTNKGIDTKYYSVSDLLNKSALNTFDQVQDDITVPPEIKSYLNELMSKYGWKGSDQLGLTVFEEDAEKLHELLVGYYNRMSKTLENTEQEAQINAVAKSLGISQLSASLINEDYDRYARRTGFSFGSLVDYPEVVKSLKEDYSTIYEKMFDKNGKYKSDKDLNTVEIETVKDVFYNRVYGELMAQKWEDMDAYTKEQLETLATGWKDQDQTGLKKSINKFDATLQQGINKRINQETQELTDQLEAVGINYNASNSFNTNENVLKNYKNLLDKFNNNEARTKEYFNRIQGQGNVLTAFQAIDWNQLTADNYEKTKEAFIKSFDKPEEQEEAGRLWAKNFSHGFYNGLVEELAPTTELAAQVVQENAEAGIDKIAEDFSKVIPAIEGQLKKGGLNPQQFKAVKESLLDVGVDPEQFLNYNSRSIKNIDDLIQKYKELGAAEVNEIKIALDAARARGASTATIEALEKSLEQTKSYWQGMANYFDQQYQEVIPEETDAEKATKEYEKALKDLAKAQEDVADKQKDLNEKIKAYNDLLNGSENRKSSLDNLYNYNEALSSFNDELSRTKDMVEDANTIDSAIDAMSRYGAATKQLITEEKAKQETIKAGLNNYGNMIENGTYAYTNSQTGETTNINFGNYARKDARTGKYMLDQRLLNEARFGDKFKDLIEQQVSEYNKYADELLKSEDNVRKAEKDIQKEREDALKKYVALETQLAEALKKQYEDEVNDQKSKYDDLKKQDDDYIDALKDAIEKQKKLREQENKWEELAQQEKKLSLMRRDTSGANAKEIASLEKDVEKSREDMLNDAIDNVVDNLEKLYESQEELRNEEMELKEAIVDNTAYWNAKAESMINSFDNAEEYAQYISSISKEYADMTLAMQQEKLAEYANTYEEATEYMALQAMDAATETGDYIVEMTTVTGQEVTNIVNQTGEAFTQEVIRQFNETTNAFTEDMKKAAEAIDAANKALQEAYEKLAECAKEADNLASKLGGGEGGSNNNPPPETKGLTEDLTPPDLKSLIHMASTDPENETLARQILQTITGNYSPNASFTKESVSSLLHTKESYVDVSKWLQGAIGLNGYQYKDGRYKDYYEIAKTLNKKYKFADGGLVNYTGPAWVDGSYSKPEAFLSAEDTARIGEAAKILADIPWLDGKNFSQSITNNRGGDVAVEINLNIDKLSSDVDVDNMIERVKKEIVEVSRPIGSPTILQQN